LADNRRGTKRKTHHSAGKRDWKKEDMEPLGPLLKKEGRRAKTLGANSETWRFKKTGSVRIHPKKAGLKRVAP